MNINFFIICIGDASKSRMARDPVLLPEKLGCHVNFPEKQGCYGQPAISSGYIKEAVPRIKNLITVLGDNDDPTISSTGSYAYVVKSYPMYLADEPGWASRAEGVAMRIQDLTSFIVNTLGVIDVGASLQRRAVYHPSCSLAHRLGVKDEPLILLKNIRGLELLTFAEQDTCYRSDGTLSVKVAEISDEMVEERTVHLVEVRPGYLIGADVNCLLSINGRLQREEQRVRVMHIAEVLVNR